jgi:hypothetical protein
LPVVPTSSSTIDTSYAYILWVPVPVLILNEPNGININAVHFGLPLISLTEENTSYSTMMNISELVPPRNQFQKFRESVPTNSYPTRNQIPLIPTDSRNRLQFRPILRCINSRNSVRFQNRMIIVRSSYSTTGTCIPFRNGILGIVSRRNYAELYGIPDRNCIITRCRSHDRIILEIEIPESDGIPRNSHRFRFQPISEFRLIPQYSTLRNRMTALTEQDVINVCLVQVPLPVWIINKQDVINLCYVQFPSCLDRQRGKRHKYIFRACRFF